MTASRPALQMALALLVSGCCASPPLPATTEATTMTAQVPEVLPTPPRQHARWTAPAGTSKAASELINSLFAAGMPDPRGCVFRTVTVETGAHAMSPVIQAWTFGAHEETWAIALSGGLFRVKELGAVADLDATLKEATMHSFSPAGITVATFPLLYRVGEVALAERTLATARGKWGAASKPAPWLSSEKLGPSEADVFQQWLITEFDTSFTAFRRGRPEELDARLDRIEQLLDRHAEQIGSAELIGTLRLHGAAARSASKRPLAPADSLTGELQRRPLVSRRMAGSAHVPRDVPGLLALAADDDGRFTQHVDFTGGLPHWHLARVSEVAVAAAFDAMRDRFVEPVMTVDVNNDMSKPAARMTAVKELNAAWERSGKPSTVIDGARLVIASDTAPAERISEVARAITRQVDRGLVERSKRSQALVEAARERSSRPTDPSRVRCAVASLVAALAPHDATVAATQLTKLLSSDGALADAASARCLGRLTARLARMGHTSVLERFADAMIRDTSNRLPSSDPMDDFEGYEDVLKPLSDLPAHPAMRQLSDQLFVAKSPWTLTGQPKGHAAYHVLELLQHRGLYAHPAVRKHISQMLADTRVVGEVVTSRRQYNVLVGGVDGMTDIVDDEFPDKPTRREVRMCDFYGYVLIPHDDSRAFFPYWPRAKRDAALAQLRRDINDRQWP